MKKSLSIERRAAKVKEQFTNKRIYQAVINVQNEAKQLTDIVQVIRTKEIENSKLLKSQQKAVEKLADDIGKVNSTNNFASSDVHELKDKIEAIQLALIKVMEDKHVDVSDNITNIKQNVQLLLDQRK